MNADETLRPVGRSGEPRDRNRRGVGADDGLGLEVRTERGENLALDLFLLGRRLDHQIAVAEIGERLRRADALDRRLALLVGDALAADLARQIAADGGDAFGNALDDDVVEQNMKPDSAQTCAMPLPIWPAPITPTLRIGCGTAAAFASLRVFGRSFTSTIFAYLLR